MNGSSFDGTRETALIAQALRSAAPDLPVALFPGSAMQLTDQVDCILFLSLVSGRNAQYLIEDHVRPVPFLERHPVATISTPDPLTHAPPLPPLHPIRQPRPMPP